MESKKRKREPEYPRIIYHAKNRTFDRLFKEDSLEATKDVVRRKLSLDAKAAIQLTQIRQGMMVDLDDDEDFEAFYAFAHSNSEASVKVTVIGTDDATDAAESPSLNVSGRVSPSKKKQKNKPLASSHSSLTPVVPMLSPPRPQTPTTETGHFSTPAKRKKRKTEFSKALADAVGTVQPSDRRNMKRTNASMVDVGRDNKDFSADSDHSVFNVQLISTLTTHGDAVSSEGQNNNSTTKATFSEQLAGALSRHAAARKQRKTLSNTDDCGSVDKSEEEPSDVADVVASLPIASSSAATSLPVPGKSKTKSRLKKPSPEVDDGNEDVEALDASARSSADQVDMAAIVAAAIAARENPSSAATPSGSEQVDIPEKTKRTKRRVGSSKLRESWTLDVNPNESAEQPSSNEVDALENISSHPVRSRSRKEGGMLHHIPCPVCLSVPFHLRYRCPVILAGPDAIEKRLKELKVDNLESRSDLILELEGLIKKAQRRRDPPPGLNPQANFESLSRDAVCPLTDANVSFTKSRPNSASGNSLLPSLDFIIPSGSQLSEGSTDDSTDTDDDKPITAAVIPARPLSDDLGVIIRGPMSSQSVLDDIPSRSASDDDPDDVVLEEDNDEDSGQYHPRRLRKAVFSEVDDSDDNDEDGSEHDSVKLRPYAPLIGMDDFQEGRRSPSPGSDTLYPASPVVLLGSVVGDLSPEDSCSQLHASTVRCSTAAEGHNVDIISSNARCEEETQVACLNNQVHKADVPVSRPLSGTDRKTLPTFTSAQFGEQKRLLSTRGGGLPSGTDPANTRIFKSNQNTVAHNSQPGNTSATEKQYQLRNDDHDSIEPAEDLLEKAPAPSPIEVDPSPSVPPKPTVTLMKPTSLAGHAAVETSSLPPSSKKRGRPPKSTLASSVKETKPPAPKVAPAPKRRGRPPKSEAIKAQEAAAKLAAKEEKIRLREEAKRVAKEEKSKSRQGKDRTKAAKVSNASLTVPSKTVHEQEVLSTPQPPSSRPLREPQSLDQWAVLRSSTPESSVMMDQLESSVVEDMLSESQRTFTAPSGQDVVNKDKENGAFVLSENQVPLLHSQWNSSSHPQEQEPDTLTAVVGANPASSNEPTTRVPKQPQRGPPTPYRRLTDIASQRALFESGMSSSYASDVTTRYSLDDMRVDDDEDDDDEDDDDSGTNSDNKGKSHIPKSRMAGLAVKAKKKRGLLSFV